MRDPLILNQADNVAILTEKGTAPAGHKIARAGIAQGQSRKSGISQSARIIRISCDAA